MSLALDLKERISPAIRPLQPHQVASAEIAMYHDEASHLADGNERSTLSAHLIPLPSPHALPVDKRVWHVDEQDSTI